MNGRTTKFISIFSFLIGDMNIWDLQGRSDIPRWSHPKCNAVFFFFFFSFSFQFYSMVFLWHDYFWSPVFKNQETRTAKILQGEVITQNPQTLFSYIAQMTKRASGGKSEHWGRLLTGWVWLSFLFYFTFSVSKVNEGQDTVNMQASVKVEFSALIS